jgi:uroporphyrin-3 C-methyltransferase
VSNTEQNSNNSEQPAVPESAASGKPKKSKARASRSGQNNGGRGLSVLAIILSLVAIGFSGYIGWRALPLEQNQPALMTGQEQLQAQIARLQARLTEANREITPLKSQLITQQNRSQRLLDRTDNLAQTIQEIAGSSREGWKLAEVEYLLRLANQRLLMTSDIQAAKALLKNADTILLELDDYTLYPVREALAEDLASINSLPDFDQEGLYLRLEALTKEVNSLPLIQKATTDTPETTETEKTEQSPAAKDWKTIAQSMLQNTWESFVNLFRFTPNREQAITALLSPEEEVLIRQNLQLLLEQSKLAVLSRDQMVYESSIKQAEKWISHYFTLSGNKTKAVQNELAELSLITVKSTTTNISRALDALKTHLNNAESASSSTPSNTPSSNQEGSGHLLQPFKAESSVDEQQSGPEPLSSDQQPSPASDEKVESSEQTTPQQSASPEGEPQT